MFEFTDTVKADASELILKRERIHYGAIFLLVAWAFITFIALVMWGVGYRATALLVETLALVYVFLCIGLIIKREIYSMMIYLKEKE